MHNLVLEEREKICEELKPNWRYRPRCRAPVAIGGRGSIRSVQLDARLRIYRQNDSQAAAELLRRVMPARASREPKPIRLVRLRLNPDLIVCLKEHPVRGRKLSDASQIPMVRRPAGGLEEERVPDGPLRDYQVLFSR